MDIDDVYIRTGEFGRFQWRAFAACCLYSLFAGTQMVQNIFAGAIPDSLICIDHNLDACDQKCPGVEFEFNSYAIEWNLTCGAGVTTMQSTQSLFMAGVMVGSFFMGGLGDKYGRFPVFMIAHVICALFGFTSSFAHSWTLYAFLRFFTGFFLSGIMIIGFVLTSELVGPSKRGIVGTVPAGIFAVGVSLLSLTAWITQEWRTMSVLLGLLGILLTPVMYYWYEESPRWHLGQGNVAMCQSILKKIARINGHDLGDINLKVSAEDEGAPKTSMQSLFRNEILLKITLVQLLSWFSNSAVYYGLTIASGDMGGNRYMSVVLSAVVEIPSNLIILYIMNTPRCGRVRSCVAGMLVSSIFCASIWFIDEGHKMAVITSACLGKFFIVASFAVIYVQAAELYPTPVRFFAGFFLSGVIIVGFVLTSELLGPSKRGVIGTTPSCAFAVGICLLTLTAWVTQHWKWMSVVLATFGLLLTPVTYCLYLESPRWHLAKGNVEKCQRVLQKIARTNGHDLGEINLKVIKQSESTSMISLFRNKILRKITLVQISTWFTASAVYYGLTIASGDMGSNRYVSVILNAVVEIPANFVIMFVMNVPRCGRVRSCMVSMIVSSIFCAGIWFVNEERESAKMVIVALACSGKFFMVMAFSIIYVQAGELYPTSVRNVGLGMVSVSTRVGGIMAPQIVNLNNLYHNSHFIVFGILGCVSGVLCLLLPETLGRPLPDTAEDIYRDVKKVDNRVVSMKVGDKMKLLNDMDDEEEEILMETKT